MECHELGKLIGALHVSPPCSGAPSWCDALGLGDAVSLEHFLARGPHLGQETVYRRPACPDKPGGLSNVAASRFEREANQLLHNLAKSREGDPLPEDVARADSTARGIERRLPRSTAFFLGGVLGGVHGALQFLAVSGEMAINLAQEQPVVNINGTKWHIPKFLHSDITK